MGSVDRHNFKIHIKGVAVKKLLLLLAFVFTVALGYAADYPQELVLSNKFGKVTVSRFAAQITSYVPAGGTEVFFFPEQKDFSKFFKMHGGVPVCWPWFGANSEPLDSPHGIARYKDWKVVELINYPEFSRLRMVLESDDSTKKIFPFDFRLVYTVTLYSRLCLSLVTENTANPRTRADKWFEITQGFHPYFRVADSSKAKLIGLEGVKRDLCRPDREGEYNEGPITFGYGFSRVYNAGRGDYELVDEIEKRKVTIRAKGHKKLILFNSGVPRGPNDNMGKEDYKRYVCVEPAVIGRENAQRILPGKRTELQMTVSVSAYEK